MPAPKTAKQRSEALAAYKAGDPAAEIIATHKICHATLYQWVREAGIPLRVPHKTIAVRETVLAAYKAGDAVAGLALEHGIGEPAIYHWIKQAGIPLRSRRHESAEKTRAIELLTAQGELARVVGRDALTLAFNDVFRLMAWVFLAALVMIPFCKPPAAGAAPPPDAH